MIFICSFNLYRHYVTRNHFVAYCIEPPDQKYWHADIRQLPELYPPMDVWAKFKAGEITDKEMVQEYEKQVLPNIDLRTYFWLRCANTAAQNIILLSHERPQALHSIRKALQKAFAARGVDVRTWTRTGPENDDDFKIDVNEKKHIFLIDKKETAENND